MRHTLSITSSGILSPHTPLNLAAALSGPLTLHHLYLLDFLLLLSQTERAAVRDIGGSSTSTCCYERGSGSEETDPHARTSTAVRDG